MTKTSTSATEAARRDGSPLERGVRAPAALLRLLELEVRCVMNAERAEWWELNRKRDETLAAVVASLGPVADPDAPADHGTLQEALISNRPLNVNQRSALYAQACRYARMEECLRRLRRWGAIPPDGDFNGGIVRDVADWLDAGDQSADLPPLPDWAA